MTLVLFRLTDETIFTKSRCCIFKNVGCRYQTCNRIPYSKTRSTNNDNNISTAIYFRFAFAQYSFRITIDNNYIVWGSLVHGWVNMTYELASVFDYSNFFNNFSFFSVSPTMIIAYFPLYGSVNLPSSYLGFWSNTWFRPIRRRQHSSNIWSGTNLQ